MKVSKHLSKLAVGLFIWHDLRLVLGAVIVIFWWLGSGRFSPQTTRWWFIGLTAAVLCLGIVGPIIRYWRFTYTILPTGVTIRQGLFVRQTTHIPYAKIQSVQRQQWFFLRPLHLEQLTIETAAKASGAGAGRLALVPESVGEQIDYYRKGGVEPVSSDGGVADPADHYEISRHDLNVYGLTSLSGLPVILVLAWGYDKVTKFVPKSELTLAEHQVASLAIGILILSLSGLLLLGMLGSYLMIIQRYYRFALTKLRGNLITTRGYFQRSQTNVPLERLQAVTFKQSLLRQWGRLSTVQAYSAGRGGEQDDDTAVKNLVLIPVLKRVDQFTVMAPFISWLPAHPVAMSTVAPARRWLLIRNCLLAWIGVLALMTGVITVALPTLRVVIWWCWPAGLLLAGFQGNYAARNHAAGIASPGVLSLQTGTFFTREQVLIPRCKIQSLKVSRSYWMGRGGCAHLSVKLRCGTGRKTIEVRYLDDEVVQRIQNWYDE